MTPPETVYLSVVSYPQEGRGNVCISLNHTVNRFCHLISYHLECVILNIGMDMSHGSSHLSRTLLLTQEFISYPYCFPHLGGVHYKVQEDKVVLTQVQLLIKGHILYPWVLFHQGTSHNFILIVVSVGRPHSYVIVSLPC